MSITARFKCIVEGIPSPTVMWLKNGKPLQISGRLKTKGNSILIVAQTVAADSGIYQCVASNRVGTATAAARLHVNTSSTSIIFSFILWAVFRYHEPINKIFIRFVIKVDEPSAPRGLIATTVSSTSILVKWNASGSPRGLHIKAYSIHYCPTEGISIACSKSLLFTTMSGLAYDEWILLSLRCCTVFL